MHSPAERMLLQLFLFGLFCACYPIIAYNAGLVGVPQNAPEEETAESLRRDAEKAIGAGGYY